MFVTQLTCRGSPSKMGSSDGKEEIPWPFTPGAACVAMASDLRDGGACFVGVARWITSKPGSSARPFGKCRYAMYSDVLMP